MYASKIYSLIFVFTLSAFSPVLTRASEPIPHRAFVIVGSKTEGRNNYSVIGTLVAITENQVQWITAGSDFKLIVHEIESAVMRSEPTPTLKIVYRLDSDGSNAAFEIDLSGTRCDSTVKHDVNASSITMDLVLEPISNNDFERRKSICIRRNESIIKELIKLPGTD